MIHNQILEKAHVCEMFEKLFPWQQGLDHLYIHIKENL